MRAAFFVLLWKYLTSRLAVLSRLAWLWVLAPVSMSVALASDAFRLYPFHTTRAPFVFPARDVRALWLSLLAQVDLVTHRRRRVLPLCRSQKVMDHPDADHHRCLDALDIVYRSEIDGQCLPIRLSFVPGSASSDVSNAGSRTCNTTDIRFYNIGPYCRYSR